MTNALHAGNRTRRAFLRQATLGWCALCIRVHAAPPGPRRRAAAFLRGQQAADGAWRSRQYGPLREGDALTPLVLWAAPELGGKGLPWLRALTARVAAAPEPWVGLAYPLFTAAYAARALAAADDQAGAAVWRGVLERLRIQSALGWPVDSAACGAWGDAPAPPRLPPGLESVPEMLAPNLSATVLALQAGAAGPPARRFVEQCQNFPDDGGFFFMPGDPVRNKAGVAGRDAAGREQYHSYGSATCDGVLALRAAGVPPEAARPQAALRWLQRHGRGGVHGGTWAPGRAQAGEGLRFYYAQAYAEVLSLAVADPNFRAWAREQQRALRTDLLAAQQSDGSWVNAYDGSFEDDPLIATAFAMRALRLLPEA
ncbi:MAG TPA: hypothetical protein VGO11_22530 [Chthoniobacteraceae bacterium]|jgi:hypothetical protein|nr:hypothetical protein [Chthoniobacteraceae bacterium]